ncbi:MAG: polymerase gamma and tau subunit [Planctomycetota bacterium]
MDYLAIARKYRPSTFTEVAGQEVIGRTLANAIRAERVHHAYLFTGPRGVGKTSTARILAKALTCEKGPTPEPCGVCEHCRMVTDGAHPDVVEIDAARFNSVETIRELADNAAFQPVRARLRIVILDEVHMLSNQAWNALLKLVEEPPAHLKFIFATTEVDRVLPTVVSRCQRFDFRALDLDTIVRRLRDISAAEGRSLPEPVLARLARAAGGGMRDAQTMLDQLIAVSADGDLEGDLDLLLGAARSAEVAALLDGTVAGDPKAAIEALDRALTGGVSPSTLLDQLIDQVRGVVLAQACGEDTPLVRRLGLDPARVAAQAKAVDQARALRMAQVLLNAQGQLRHGHDARLTLELAIVRLAQTAQLVDLETLVRRLERLEAPAQAGPAPLRPR